MFASQVRMSRTSWLSLFGEGKAIFDAAISRSRRNLETNELSGLQATELNVNTYATQRKEPKDIACLWLVRRLGKCSSRNEVSESTQRRR